MDLVSLTRALRDLTAEQIRAVAADLDDLVRSPAEEVAATKVILAIEHAVRASRHQAQAGLAAHSLVQAVLEAAKRSRIRLPNDDVTRVARAAAQIGRGLVAGPALAAEVQALLMGFRGLPAVTVVPAVPVVAA